MTTNTNMVSGGALPSLPEMKFEGNLKEAFDKWVQRFEIYILANGLESASEKRRISILLNFIGEKGIEIYNTFNLQGNETLKTVIDLFKAYVSPKKSLLMLRNEFFTLYQKDMRLEEYFQKVINLGKQCEFGELTESLTVTKLIAGLDQKYNNFKTKLIAEEDDKLTLTYVMKYLICAEASRQFVETQKMDIGEEATVYYGGNMRRKGVPARANSTKIRNCRNCGLNHNLNMCPAFGKTCHKCNKLNHFSKMCRSATTSKKQVHVLKEEEASEEDLQGDDFFIGSISTGNEILQEFTINNVGIVMKMDTGAACNVIGSELCKKIGVKDSEIQYCNKKVVQLDGKRVPVRGTCYLEIIHPNKNKYKVKFVVIEGKIPTLLGCQTCLQFDFVSANTDLVNILNLSCKNEKTSMLIKNLKNDFSSLFDGGLGCVPGTTKIQLTEDAVPVVQAARRVPFSLVPELREELTRMEKMGVIEKVEKPTKWVNNIVLVRKPNGKLRICIDPRALNKYVIEPKYQLPTIDEIKSKMQNAKVFALLDASNGFWMLNLDEESSDLCTFITPFGRYKFRRLPFGISSAPEEFSRVIAQMFENVEGVIPYMDDLCLWAESVEELNGRLRKVMEIAVKNGIKFNKDKCKLFVSELLFVGQLFTAKGVSPDPNKVQAIMKMEQPKCKKDLERFLGPLPPPALTDKLRLYHVDMNPYGHRVLLILEAKKARYEVYKLDPLRLPEWFRSKNPRLKIPVLEIPTDAGDKYLFESVVICDYLDEKYTRNQLHSRDPYVKAQDRLLIERFNELIKGSLECFDTNFAFGSEQIVQTLDIFEKELASRGTNYFGGNRPGMLDYMIWPWIERLYLLRCVNERKFDEKRGLFPNFADWGDQMQLDEVVKKHANSPQEYFDYYKNARTHSMGYYL